MKLALIFLLSAFVVISQQFQYKARPKGLFWLSPYSPTGVNSYQQSVQRFYKDYLHNEVPVPLRSHWKPSTRIGEIVTFFKGEDLNPDLIFTNEEEKESQGNNDDEQIGNFFQNIVEDESVFEVPVDSQSRAKGVLRWPSEFHNKQNAGRFFYSSTINNPFLKTATFTLSSTVTTVGSIVLCVPANNLAAVPAPTCAGRKRRESQDTDDVQFPISPTETIKLMPTALPSLDSTLTNNRESRHFPIEHLQVNPQDVHSSKDEISPSGIMEDETNPREKRFFGGGIAASTTVTSYSFVGATLTSTVLLDPTGMNVAVCLPSGYVVCA